MSKLLSHIPPVKNVLQNACEKFPIKSNSEKFVFIFKRHSTQIG